MGQQAEFNPRVGERFQVIKEGSTVGMVITKTNEFFSDVGGLSRRNISRDEGCGSTAHLLSNKGLHRGARRHAATEAK